jgi:NAD(P)-dependent dehydrogenase (short-subunit alcohol dehydrogenase family)
MSLFDLTGRVALVTGASRGIGRAIAMRLAEQGARTVVSSRSTEATLQVVEYINSTHGVGRAAGIAANISSKPDLERLVDHTHKTFGPIDILVCNAATNIHFGPFSAIRDDAFRKILDNNIVSNHWLAQLTLPDMIARREGAVIFISSIGAMRGSALIGAYNVSKAALLQMARDLAVELGVYNIRVNCVAPGLVKTDFARALWESPTISAEAITSTPLKRIGEPDDIAGAVVFLASPAARYITGQTIIVDGGSTIFNSTMNP